MSSTARYRLFCCGLAFSILGYVSITVAGPLNGYADYEQFSATVKELANSNLVQVSSLGKSLGGRELQLITITRPQDKAAVGSPKPGILVLGSVYAAHLVGGELAVRMCQQIVARADQEPYRQLLDRYVLYVIPRPNPDAMEAMFARPYAERALNTHSTDDDRDFEFDEDPNEDLNADGWITTMRVEDPTGRWMLHPADSRVMIEADPKKNESGRYLLYSEGVDNDKDNKWNEDGQGGVDFNRNFTFRYAFFTPGAGRHQVSEIESRAVTDFAFAHPNIALVFSFSPQDNLLETWKPGNDADKIKTAVLSADADPLNYMAEQYRTLHGGKDWPSPAKGEGDFASWAYFHYGRWSLSARAWWVPKVEPEKPIDEKRGADNLNALRWLAAQKIDGFVDWKPLEHPDFSGKKVEIGGFKPFFCLNPPAAELPALAEKHSQYLGKLVGLMPQLQLEAPRVESLGNGIFRVTVRALNTGYLPTMSVMGRTTRLLNTLQLKIDLPAGAKLLTSHPRVAIEPVVGNGGSREHVWLVNAVEAKGTSATVRVWSSSVGSDEKTFELK